MTAEEQAVLGTAWELLDQASETAEGLRQLSIIGRKPVSRSALVAADWAVVVRGERLVRIGATVFGVANPA